MRRAILIRISAIAGLVVGLASQSAQAQCGGLCLYENMTPDMGRSAAGAGARAQDASTAFWNPAGMTELGDGTEVIFGLGAAFGQLQPQLDGGTVTPNPPVRDGGNASGFSPLFGSYISTKLPYDVHVGMVLTPLYGGAVDYDQNWTGRTQVTDASLFALLIQPSLAYAVTDWLSIGAGPTVLYTVLNQRLKATDAPAAPTIKIDNADDWAAGGAFSVLLKPLKGTRVGIYYRTQINANTDGHLEGPLGLNPSFDGKLNFPQGVNVSLFQQVCEQWAILADAGWTQWSKFGNIPLSIGPLGATGHLDWNDTWRTAIGFQYVPTEKWTLQGGFGYDSSPVKQSNLQPVLPTSEQYRFSAGLMYRPQSYVEIGLSYTFEWFGDMKIDHVGLPPANNVVLNGKYDPAYANIVGASLRVKF